QSGLRFYSHPGTLFLTLTKTPINTVIGHNGPLIETQPKSTSGYHWLHPTLLSLNWQNDAR
ncbi:MAG: hypothetical protein QGH37_34360, partial [Candidatus Poribacteria bacterium]|nr:hypothetical protein [Candidatus Poribacteria bacterium]